MKLAEKPMIITLDFHDCEYPKQIHQVLKEAFVFPDWYGRNWSEFWDLLNEPREYTVVEVTGLYSLHKELYEYSEKIIELLEKTRIIIRILWKYKINGTDDLIIRSLIDVMII